MRMGTMNMDTAVDMLSSHEATDGAPGTLALVATRQAFTGECFNCGEPGHKGHKCRKPKATGDGAVPTNANRGTHVIGSPSSDSVTSGSSAWMLDSGASASMRRWREAFSRLEPADGECVVRQADGTGLEVKGVGARWAFGSVGKGCSS